MFSNSNHKKINYTKESHLHRLSDCMSVSALIGHSFVSGWQIHFKGALLNIPCDQENGTIQGIKHQPAYFWNFYLDSSLCHGELYVVPECVRKRLASNEYSTVTTWQIGMKVHRQHPLNVLYRWCSGRASTSGSGDRWFDPQRCHTEDFKNGSNGYPSLALRVVGLALRLTHCCQSKLTRSTGYLPRKRCDISEHCVQSGVKHKTNKQFLSERKEHFFSTETGLPNFK